MKRSSLGDEVTIEEASDGDRGEMRFATARLAVTGGLTGGLTGEQETSGCLAAAAPENWQTPLGPQSNAN